MKNLESPCARCGNTPQTYICDHLSAVLDSLDLLREYLLEAHTPEMDDGHGGDSDHEGADPEGCTYCAAIKEAFEVSEAAKRSKAASNG